MSASTATAREDLWDTLVAVMPVLALAWIVGASAWSARVVGLL